MAKLIFAMNLSLDGYVDHTAFAPGPRLFQHFVAQAEGLAGSLYGRVIYGIMRYWDDEQPGWDAAEHAFAAAWRRQEKWVVSASLTEVGPNARLLGPDLAAEVRRIKAEVAGDVAVAGPALAYGLGQLGLIDEYQLYLHPVVLGGGTPFFAGPRPPLRLVDSAEMGEDVLRLVYAPA